MPSKRALVIADAVALVLFVAVGAVNHGEELTVLEIGATLIPFLASWFAVAAIVGAYRDDGWRRLAITWLVAVPVAAVARSVLRAGPWDERLVIFAGVALAFTAMFVLAGRVAVGAWSRARGQGPSPSDRREASSDVTS